MQSNAAATEFKGRERQNWRKIISRVINRHEPNIPNMGFD